MPIFCVSTEHRTITLERIATHALRAELRIVLVLLTLISSGYTVFAPPDVIVAGAGDPDSNGSFKDVGSVNGKPQFQSEGVVTVFIEWDGSQWILYNTGLVKKPSGPATPTPTVS